MTFVLLMITNWFLWNYIKRHNLRSISNISKKNSSMGGVENIKYMTISLVFAISYIYRGMYDTLLGFTDTLSNMAED